MNIDEDGYIIINSIKVNIKETDRLQEIKNIIADSTGYDKELITVGWEWYMNIKEKLKSL